MKSSRAGMTIKFVAVDLVGSALYFPLWWYTSGMIRTIKFCGRTVANTANSLGLPVWIKNLFVPMFGQRDITSRLISFFMRLVTILAYTVLLIMQSVLMLLLFAVWMVLPVLVVFEFGFHLLGLLAS